MPTNTTESPITVTVDHDPRGVSVGVWQGSHCIYSGAHPLPTAPGVSTVEDERAERAAFNVAYEGLCDRPITIREIAWRMWQTAAGTRPSRHPDDIAVDRFAVAMKAKLAKKRAEGRGGWSDKSQCTAEFLSQLLRGHVEKGDPVDVGNLAMMLHQRGEAIAPAAGDAQDLTLAQKYEDACILANANARDAARYRWLRDPQNDPALVLDKRTGYVPEDESVRGVGGYYTYEYRAGEELDAAIDAAIAAQRKGDA